MHVYTCVVHEPKKQRFKAKHFKDPPNKVTDENISFWNQEVEVGGSICKDCYIKYGNRQRDQMRHVNTLPNEINV